MRVKCQRFGPEMCHFSGLDNKKQELVRMFVEYLQSDKHGRKKHGHGHHEKFGSVFERYGFEKRHGHGMYLGRHGHHGPRNHHGPHGYHGPHDHHGPHGHLGPHGHHGPHGRRGRHCHRGRHGLHGPDNGKFCAQWTIDLTCDESGNSSDNVIESGRDQSTPANETGPANQNQEAGTKKHNCKCSRFGRPSGWFGRKKVQKTKQVAENSCQTDDNVEEPEDNLTGTVELINTENAE